MSEANVRDIDPPEDGTDAEPPWELWLGHDLEQYFSFFTEIHYVALGGFPDGTLDDLATIRRWVVHQLRELRLPDVLVNAVDDAVADVRPLTDPSVITDRERWRKRRAVGATFEVLLQLTRAHVPPRHRRYYDFGVMLRQINTRVTLIRTAPALPSWVEEGWPNLAERYRDELRRECATLASWVRDKGPGNSADPAQSSLDGAFDALADHLESWLAEENEIDDVFLERLQTAWRRSGLLGSTRTARDITRH
ncbi:hypothetical protein [Actinomadura spongiicola]|uniref:hypothetical protein n=1 Tax=Actinomadura spongiicola TaxID=2303421 RepID=UPI001313FC8B|nr:hypothetical protein [Actinomadura spongiicola]